MVEPRRLSELERRLLGLLDLPDGPLAVGLSGGADSAALAYLVLRLGRDLRAIHVNHGYPASAALEAAARRVAEDLRVEIDVLEVVVPSGPSAEGQARRVRYQALLGRLAGGEWLLTAHTLDDQAETVVLNLLRGAGPTGLSGIPTRSGSVARPMLGVRRSDTRELAALAGLEFLDDPANLDPTLRRNVIRLEVLPQLAGRFNPRLHESLARAATLLASDDRVLDELADQVEVLVGENMAAVAIGALETVPGPVGDRVIRRCLARLRPPYSGTAREVRTIRSVISREVEATRVGGDVLISVEGPNLVFRSSTGPISVGEPVELAPGSHLIGSFEVVVDHVDRVCRAAPVGLWSAIFDPTASLFGRVDRHGGLVIEADGAPAWLPGERRLDVAWYRPGSTGYLSVLATERSGWT